MSRPHALSRSTAVIEHRDGADPENSRKVPGRTSYEPVALEREIVGDKDFAAQQEPIRTRRRGDRTGSALTPGAASGPALSVAPLVATAPWLWSAPWSTLIAPVHGPGEREQAKMRRVPIRTRV